MSADLFVLSLSSLPRSAAYVAALGRASWHADKAGVSGPTQRFHCEMASAWIKAAACFEVLS